MEIPGYRIVRELGRGGMSTVYLAVQESLDRQIALKVMSQALARDQSFKDRFLKEGRIVARLNHRNIVTIYDIGLVDTVSYIAMEYIVGRNLDERIQEGLSVSQSIHILKRVARALGHAHDRGFIHRDLKPSNVLFRDDQDAVLADFGIAKGLRETRGLTVTGLTPGTPNYMSPEQLRGRTLDGRSDLYSLGVVFYEMLTRKRPFEADTDITTALRHLNEPPPELPGEFSLLRPVVSRLLAKEPADRFTDATELIKALDHITDNRSDEDLEYADQAVVEDKATVLVPNAAVFEAKTISPASRQVVEAEATVFKPEARIARAKTTTLDSRPIVAERKATTLQSSASVEPAVTPLEPAPKTSRWRLYSAVGAALGVALAALIAFNSLREDVTLPQQPTPKPLSPKVREEIKTLLQVADVHFLVGRLMAPPGSNAFYAYHRVLDLHPGDARATAGLERIADRYYEQARTYIKDGSVDEARSMIRDGLRAWPSHRGLSELRKKYGVGKESR